MSVSDNEIKMMMNKYKKYAVYGLSHDVSKPSHSVPAYMRAHGWDPVGIYPKQHVASQFQIFSQLAGVPVEYRKMVNVFRSSDKVNEVVDEIIAIGGVELLWLQLGISNADAERRAEGAGIKVISNRCMVIEHKRWF